MSENYERVRLERYRFCLNVCGIALFLHCQYNCLIAFTFVFFSPQCGADFVKVQQKAPEGETILSLFLSPLLPICRHFLFPHRNSYVQ